MPTTSISSGMSSGVGTAFPGVAASSSAWRVPRIRAGLNSVIPGGRGGTTMQSEMVAGSIEAQL
jgi:hypothetical protein